MKQRRVLEFKRMAPGGYIYGCGDVELLFAARSLAQSFAVTNGLKFVTP